MPRTIIFCRRYRECAQIYLICIIEQSLQTACTEASIKEDIVAEFSKADSRLRIVIGTIAFGMGLDCPDVRQILHWSASYDVESYIQETGRCGRDGYTANAVLFYSKAEERITSPLMVEYCQNNKSCRRDMLFHDFDDSDTLEKLCSLCMCCDICALSVNVKIMQTQCVFIYSQYLEDV